MGGVSVADLRMANVSIDDLRSAGVTTHELHRGGFTIDQMQSAGLTISQIHAGGVSTAQLKDAGITITQMRNAGLIVSEIHAGGVSIADLLEEDDLTLIKLRTGGVPDYALFNEACNTPPRSTGTAPAPTITITSLTAASTEVELRTTTGGSIRWRLSGMNVQFTDSNSEGTERSLRIGDTTVTARLVSKGSNFVSTLSIPFAFVFSNPSSTVEVGDGQTKRASIQLCPGR